MDVCVHCAAIAARLVEASLLRRKAEETVLYLQRQLQDTDQAFWELAGDVRLSPVHVHLVDDYVSVLFPADETERKAVSA